MPAAARKWAHALVALYGIFAQKNISPGNIAWAEDLAVQGDEELRAVASLVAEVGLLHPRRRKRNGFIRHHHPDVWQRMVAAGVVDEFEDHRRDEVD